MLPARKKLTGATPLCFMALDPAVFPATIVRVANDILVINAGSSSIKLSLFGHSTGDPTLVLSGQIDGLGTPHVHAVAKDAKRQVLFEQNWSDGSGPKNHAEAMAVVVEKLAANRPNWKPAGVGHRVVHGGMKEFQEPVGIDAAVVSELKSIAPMAPLHIPGNLQGIDAVGRAFPGVPQVACFDTAFHQGRPFVAQAFALPRSYYDEGVRRFGFHGLSYEYVASAMRTIAPEVVRGRMIVAHLGNGASLCAMHDGRCVETTMGFTAVEGLPMGTRCGQIDPGVLLWLIEFKKMPARQVIDMIHNQSGLLGLSGISSDMRDLLASDSSHACEAVDYFVYRATWYIGALMASLGGLDGLVFTAGIGEHAAPIRERICRNLAWLGLELDSAANAAAKTCISTARSQVSAWIVPTNEELMIARHVVQVLKL
jgi:acetate kinase